MEQQTPVVIVISHGHLCEELIRSTAMVYGPLEEIEALPLEEGADPDTYREQLEAMIDRHEGNVFVCVDIMGGTPFKSLAYAARTRKLAALAGINMPMLIDVLDNRDELQGAELAAQVSENCAAIPCNLTSFLEKAFNM